MPALIRSDRPTLRMVGRLPRFFDAPHRFTGGRGASGEPCPSAAGASAENGAFRTMPSCFAAPTLHRHGKTKGGQRMAYSTEGARTIVLLLSITTALPALGVSAALGSISFSLKGARRRRAWHGERRSCCSSCRSWSPSCSCRSCGPRWRASSKGWGLRGLTFSGLSCRRAHWLWRCSIG